MPRNSSGTYTLPLPPVVPGTVIEAEWANDTLADIAQALTESLDRGGRGGMTGPFFMADGSAGAPGMAFENEPATGFYRAGTGQLGISTQGVARATFDVNGINTAAVFVTSAITQATQLATKKYVDDATGGGGPGTGFLPLTGGAMTGGIDFKNVPGPMAFYDTPGTTLWGAIDVTSAFMRFTSGGQYMQFTPGGILSAPNISAAGDLNANNDVYAGRYIGLGVNGSLIYNAVDPTFGPYLGMRSASGGAAFTHFDDGTSASSVFRGLNGVISTGRMDAYNQGLRIRPGTVLNAGTFVEMIVDASGTMIFRNNGQTPIFSIDQSGNVKALGTITPSSTPG